LEEPVEPEAHYDGAPIQHASVSITMFGVRMRADGRTGWEAWQALRRQYPALAWVAGGYVVLLVLAAVLLVLSLF
jgi:hypothetical protein